MHTPIERVIEILIFTIINTVPYHLCAIYPFRKNLRFYFDYRKPPDDD